MPDPFGAKRAAMCEEFFARHFLLGGWLGGTDTYKRTMWAAVPDVALAHAGYSLTMRRGLPEPGAGDQLIMAGHEAMLAQWFHRPLLRADVELAARWYADLSATRAFPKELWRSLLDGQTGDELRLPVDVWGFPGGQTFLAGVPCLTFEGPGGFLSYLEPAMCRYFAPIIQATKGRLMWLASSRSAEEAAKARSAILRQVKSCLGAGWSEAADRSNPSYVVLHSAARPVSITVSTDQTDSKKHVVRLIVFVRRN